MIKWPSKASSVFYAFFMRRVVVSDICAAISFTDIYVRGAMHRRKRGRTSASTLSPAPSNAKSLKMTAYVAPQGAATRLNAAPTRSSTTPSPPRSECASYAAPTGSASTLVVVKAPRTSSFVSPTRYGETEDTAAVPPPPPPSSTSMTIPTEKRTSLCAASLIFADRQRNPQGFVDISCQSQQLSCPQVENQSPHYNEEDHAIAGERKSTQPVRQVTPTPLLYKSLTRGVYTVITVFHARTDWK